VDCTIQEETLEGLLDIELCVEDDEAEGDRECIVAGVALEKVADGVDVGIVDVYWV